MFNCELFRMDTLFYIFSLAFQVAGAVILIIKYFGKTKERIIEEYYPGSNIAERDENNTIVLEKEKLQTCARKIYDNRASFSFIAIGYILSIFGDISNQCKVCVLMMTVTCTVTIILIEKGVAIILSKIFYRKDEKIPFDKVKHIADTAMTQDEVSKMFNETEIMEDLKSEQ